MSNKTVNKSKAADDIEVPEEDSKTNSSTAADDIENEDIAPFLAESARENAAKTETEEDERASHMEEMLSDDAMMKDIRNQMWKAIKATSEITWVDAEGKIRPIRKMLVYFAMPSQKVQLSLNSGIPGTAKLSVPVYNNPEGKQYPSASNEWSKVAESIAADLSEAGYEVKTNLGRSEISVRW